MSPFLVILPLVIVFVAVVYGILRMFGHIWLEHRIRLTLLEKIEKRPELVDSVHDLVNLLGAAEALPARKDRQDYALTGALLAAMGVGFCLLGRMLHSGKLAVGIYVGGWVCVVLGLLLFAVGLFIRKLLRQPIMLPRRD